MKATVGHSSAKGEAGRKDIVMDEKVNVWHTAESDIGAIDVKTGGENTLRLVAEKIEKSEQGVTVSGVKLERVS